MNEDQKKELAKLRDEVSVLNSTVAELLMQLRLPEKGMREVQQAIRRPARFVTGSDAITAAALQMRSADTEEG
jgi:hypothetical protein